MANNKKNNKKNNQADRRQSIQTARQIANANSRKKTEKVGIREYWKGVRQEMGKVVWPTRKELGAFTAVVICTCAVFALGFWAVDSGFLAILRATLGITLN